jgi:chromosomal replication initiator protein
VIVSTWQKCIYCLKNELPAQQFNTWIRPLKIIVDNTELESGKEVLYLLAPNKFVLEWVKDHFLNRIEELLDELSIKAAPLLRLDISNDDKFNMKTAVSTSDLGSIEARNENQDSSDLPTEVSLAPSRWSRQNILKINHESALGSSLQQPATIKAQHANMGSGKLRGRLRYKGELNRSYTFNNFIEGKSNQLARAAAAQVAGNPGQAYNPLFIYGGVGLGKTHLMHSIGNHLLEQNPNANVVYLHSQTFVGSMVSALQLNAINEFKRYYHSVDVLLIDDIQFFANKERSQEEFFHTFNAIFEAGSQIIMTCDKYHSEINGLEERLKSRFGWGLSVAIEPPELETRAAILINKANRENVYLPNQEAMFMAQKLRSNVRELEGALKKVIAHARFTGSEISVPLIKEALKDLLAIQNKLISVDNIQRTVAEYYKIKLTDMISKRRNRSIARPRQIAMCLSKELTNHSLPEIGTMYGDRDHTTVLHACRTINELKKSSSDINEDYQNLLRSLSS